MPRTGIQKVKSGCITCKIRKIKCDEGRPQCSRCVSTGRRCDGYTTPPKGTYSWAQLLRARPLSDTLHPSASTCNDASVAEKRALCFFQRVAAPALAGSLNRYFWANIVIQIATQEPVAKHAVLALSAVYEDFCKRSLEGIPVRRDRENPFAVSNYNKAIRLLQTTTDRALILFICILFICIELLRKNSKDAITHCRHGINIFNEVHSESDFLKNHVKPAIRHLSLVPYLYGIDPKSFPCLKDAAELRPSTEFSSFSEAHAQLVPILVRAVRFVRSGSEGCLGAGIKGPEPGAEWVRQSILAELEDWFGLFRNLKRRGATDDEELYSLRLLEIRGITAKIWTATCFRPASECVYDAYVDEFREIINLATPEESADTDLESARKRPSIFGERSALELGFSSFLTYAVAKCRVLSLRISALKLMKRLSHPGDNIWDEGLMVALGRRLIEMEHKIQLDDENNWEPADNWELPPEEDRIVDFGIHCVREENRPLRRDVHFLSRKGKSCEYFVEGEWHLMEKDRPISL